MTWTLLGQYGADGRIDANRVATITTPSADWNGLETITFTATDPGMLRFRSRRVYRDGDQRRAGRGRYPEPDVAEGSNFVTINLDDYVSDVDNLASEMTWTYSATPR